MGNKLTQLYESRATRAVGAILIPLGALGLSGCGNDIERQYFEAEVTCDTPYSGKAAAKDPIVQPEDNSVIVGCPTNTKLQVHSTSRESTSFLGNHTNTVFGSNYIETNFTGKINNSETPGEVSDEITYTLKDGEFIIRGPEGFSLESVRKN